MPLPHGEDPGEGHASPHDTAHDPLGRAPHELTADDFRETRWSDYREGGADSPAGRGYPGAGLQGGSDYHSYGYAPGAPASTASPDSAGGWGGSHGSAPSFVPWSQPSLPDVGPIEAPAQETGDYSWHGYAGGGYQDRGYSDAGYSGAGYSGAGYSGAGSSQAWGAGYPTAPPAWGSPTPDLPSYEQPPLGYPDVHSTPYSSDWPYASGTPAGPGEHWPSRANDYPDTTWSTPGGSQYPSEAHSAIAPETRAHPATGSGYPGFLPDPQPVAPYARPDHYDPYPGPEYPRDHGPAVYGAGGHQASESGRDDSSWGYETWGGEAAQGTYGVDPATRAHEVPGGYSGGYGVDSATRAHEVPGGYSGGYGVDSATRAHEVPGGYSGGYGVDSATRAHEVPGAYSGGYGVDSATRAHEVPSPGYPGAEASATGSGLSALSQASTEGPLASGAYGTAYLTPDATSQEHHSLDPVVDPYDTAWPGPVPDEDTQPGVTVWAGDETVGAPTVDAPAEPYAGPYAELYAAANAHRHAPPAEGAPPTEPPILRRSAGAGGGARPRATWKRRSLVAALTILVLLAGVGGYAVVKLGGNLSRIDLSSLLGGSRPSPAAGQGAMNILLVGSDTAADTTSSTSDALAGYADITLLIHLPANRSGITVVSLPGTAMVRSPRDCADPKSTVDGGVVREWSANFGKGGAPCVMRAFEGNSDIHVDHVAVVDTHGFQTLVESLGGVDVCSSAALHDTSGDFDLSAGRHHLDGRQATGYVEADVKGQADLARIARQQVLMSSVAQKASSSKLLQRPDTLYRFLMTAMSSATFDPKLDIGGLKDLALSIKDVALHDIQFVTVPTQRYALNPSRLEWTPAADQLWTAIRSDSPIPGSAAANPAGKATTSVPNEGDLTVSPAKITIRLVNDTGVNGLARETARPLEAQGFRIDSSVTGKVGTVTGVEVRYAPAQAEAAKTVAAAFPGSKLVPSTSAGSVVQVHLGLGAPAVVEVPNRVGSGPLPKPTVSAPAAPKATAVKLAPRTADQDICH